MGARFLIVAVALAVVGGAAAGAASLEAAAGQALFSRNWISAPASLAAETGLGPHYDARSCAACHPAAGPGPVGEVGRGMAVRLGDRQGRPDPVYGAQLQTRAVSGADPEARLEMAWVQAALGRRPEVRVQALAYGPLAGAQRLSLRRAPSLAGLAALDDVPSSEILRQAALQARRRDGVSGRPAWLKTEAGAAMLGRWGWKATQAGLPQQVRTSLSRDVGITTPGPELAEETPREVRAGRVQSRRGAEAPATVTAALVDYLRSIPAPVGPDPAAPGGAVFSRIGCGACHTTLKGADGRPVRAFTDLLLHDLGPGLDDGAAEGRALSQEWRTAPLWTVAAELRGGGLLHDGRARTVAEAVRWHGGEASRSRRRFGALSSDERRQVAAFLGGW